MKTAFVIIVLSVTLLFSQPKPISLSATNPVSIGRPNEIISIDLSGVYQKHPELRHIPLIVREGKKELVSQTIDNNSDGEADELIFQASFRSKEKKDFLLSPKITKDLKKYQSHVDGRFVAPREDFAWENDRIAFRMYGPALAAEVNNGIDVWTKRVRYPIVKKWYEGEEQDPKIVYHIDHGEGADFFNVGRSLGAGGSGLFLNGHLIQPGVFSHYKIIANGPLRVIFDVYYDAWNLGGKKGLQRKRISLDAGSQLNTIEDEFVFNYPPDSLVIAAGLVKRSNTTFQTADDRQWMSLWGLTTADSVNGFLGTAVVFPAAVNGVDEDSLQYLLRTSIGSNKKFTYYAGAAWTRMGDIQSEKEWTEYLKKFVEALQHPLTITIN
ncbi:MAG: DUF4861 family protein [Bacteroidota bacterium]|jgi:pectinesterase